MTGPNDMLLDPDWTGLEAEPLMDLSDEEFEEALDKAFKELDEEED